MIEGRTLWDLIEKRAAATPDARMAIDENGDRLTFAEYRDRSERAAAGLAAHGIGEGDTITWQLPTWLESMVLVGAIARLGVSQNPILHIYREREVGFCVKQTGAKVLMVPTEFGGFGFKEMAEDLAADTPGVEVLIADRELPDGEPSTLPSAPESGDEVRWYFYTSGTTADPKGAQHTDLTIQAMAKGMCERLAVMESDANALVFPFTHIGGIGWLFASLMTGCSNILIAAFVPDVVVSTLGREGVTLAGAGTVFHQVYLGAQARSGAPIFPEVRAFPGGGSPKPPQLHHGMRAAFGCGILSGYGLTEAPILTMASIDDDDDDLANTEGSAMPGVKLKLVKLDGSVAATGEEGEVRAKAPQLMVGYLDGSLDAEGFDDDGFFKTGDLGRLNERGMLAITGRVKDVIIRKGENVSAKEVEDHLYAHPKIGDVAVIGIPDDERGEMVCAVVTSAEGVGGADAAAGVGDGNGDGGDGGIAESEITLAEMADFLKAEGLMVQKLPERLEIVTVIPRNPAGKILKHELRTRFS